MRDDSFLQDRVVRDYFRTTSAVSADGHARGAALLNLRRRLGRWLDVQGKDVIDLGSGTGELCQLALEASARSVTGVNLSSDENQFSERFCEAEFVCESVDTYLCSRGSASCDVVFALNILEHLDKGTLHRVLAEVIRVLRSGGSLVAMVPNATSPFGSMTRYWDITHQLAFTPSSVRQLARLVGFSEPQFRECGPIPHGILSCIRFVLWQGIRAAIWAYFMIELASGKGGIYTADMLFRLTKPESTSETQ